jgi:acetyl-CoA carboxylase biotin carboxylase subunit
MFKKILIANREKCVTRNELKWALKRAVYSTADAESLHVKFADEAVCIGPPQATVLFEMSNNCCKLQMQMQYIQDTDFFLKILNFLKFVRTRNQIHWASPEMIDRMEIKLLLNRL